MMKVASVQYQAALAVTGAWKGSSRMKLYEELGWESLDDRRMRKRIFQIHKIIDNKTPSYLRNKLPPNRNNLLYLPYIFQEIQCRTQRYRNSFYPDAIASWNNTMSLFENFPSFNVLKHQMMKCVRPEPRSVFGIHRPSSIRYIFQLRVGLSLLRSHKKHHNFADTPSDICLCKQGNEDTKHFLLYCPFYATHRAVLSKFVNDILQKNQITTVNDYVHLYLYGHSSLSITENRKILAATIDFIEKSNRFSQ